MFMSYKKNLEVEKNICEMFDTLHTNARKKCILTLTTWIVALKNLSKYFCTMHIWFRMYMDIFLFYNNQIIYYKH